MTFEKEGVYSVALSVENKWNCSDSIIKSVQVMPDVVVFVPSAFTPNADACLPGITRQKVIQLAQELSVPVFLKNLSLAEFYNADEVFTTGTMGELTPVTEIDGRKIENMASSSVREKIYAAFRTLTANSGELME